MALQRDDLPSLPPEVVNPDPDAEDWLGELVVYMGDVIAETEVPAAHVGRALAHPFDGERDDAMPERARRWEISGDGTAEWAMAHVVGAEVELARLQEQADAWRERIGEWFEHRARPLQATAAFFTDHLERYALMLRDEDPKAKTLVLPSGAVKTREHKPAVIVADEAQVVGWADATLGDDAATVAPVIRKVYVNPLREHVQIVEVIDHARLTLSTGELVDWLNVLRPDSGDDLHPIPGNPIVEGGTCPGLGDGWPTPDDATALVARVEVLASHDEVRGPNGLPVPGVEIEPGRVTAKVVPSP